MVPIPVGKMSQSTFASVAQRYWNDEWSTIKNHQIYGAEASSEGLGHNLRIVLSAMDGPGLDSSDILQRLTSSKKLVDHQCLFGPERPREFPGSASTLERVTLILFREACRPPLPLGTSLQLTIWESETVGCTVSSTQPHQPIEVHLRRHNLILSLRAQVDEQTGLAVSRDQVFARLDQIQQDWVNAPRIPGNWREHLFQQIKKELPQLESVHIDLGCHEFLNVRS